MLSSWIALKETVRLCNTGQSSRHSINICNIHYWSYIVNRYFLPVTAFVFVSLAFSVIRTEPIY